MLVEIVSQSYRCVLPITPWIYFLLDDDDNASGRISFASMLLLAYVGFKVCTSFFYTLSGSGVCEQCPFCLKAFGTKKLFVCARACVHECACVISSVIYTLS